jgi:hypothetical protein
MPDSVKYLLSSLYECFTSTSLGLLIEVATMIVFRPNCSFPTTEPSGFVYSPNIRSTLDIVWSCTSIIILSTWSVLHLTVPPDIKAKSLRQKFRKQIYLLQRKISWMGIMLMFPEYLLAIGAANWLVARENTRTLEKLAKGDKVPWSRTHTIQADMGGMAVCFSERSKQTTSNRKSRRSSISSDNISREGPISASKRRDQLPDSIVHSPMTQPVNECTYSKKFMEPTVSISRMPLESEGLPKFIQDFQKSQKRYLSGLGKIKWEPFGRHLGLAAEYAEDTFHTSPANKTTITKANHLAPLHGNIWILDSKQLALAREHGVIKELPFVYKEEIQDKSKSDGLVRILAVIQVLWLVVQMVSRRIVRVSSSALEFSTLAFSSCAFIIYLIEWRKPKDVAVPIYIKTDAVVSPETFRAVAEAAPTIFMRDRYYCMPQSCVHQVIEGPGRYKGEHVDRLIVLTSILTTTLFGGVHLLAWNLDFPTPVERLLWRTAALSVAIVPTICALLVLVESLVFGTTNRTSKPVVFIFGPLYISSRLYLIVESFRSLYFLPSETFIATWAISSPHIG